MSEQSRVSRVKVPPKQQDPVYKAQQAAITRKAEQAAANNRGGKA